MSGPIKAVVLGGNGQDGSYLCEHAVRAGKAVLAIGRQPTARYPVSSDLYRYRQVDLTDSRALVQALRAFQPDEAYHLAAVHGSSGFAYEELWEQALDVNVKSLQVVLEHARTQNPELRVVYASSAKVFGTPLQGRLSIESPRKQDCLYAITKIAAEGLIDYYYREHGVTGSLAYFFNHESPRRGKEFFFSRICRILACCLDDPGFRGTVANLDFHLDWGSAEEFMGFFHDMATLKEPRKLILATGTVLHARSFVEALWSRYGLDARDHLIETHPIAQPRAFSVDLSYTATVMGRVPQVRALDLAAEMVVQSRRALKSDYSDAPASRQP